MLAIYGKMTIWFRYACWLWYISIHAIIDLTNICLVLVSLFLKLAYLLRVGKDNFILSVSGTHVIGIVFVDGMHPLSFCISIRLLSV